MVECACTVCNTYIKYMDASTVEPQSALRLRLHEFCALIKACSRKEILVTES